jgi:hypothetical protein
VWNQDVVPFVIIRTPENIRLYSGFRHQRQLDGSVDGVLGKFNELSELIKGFHADAINQGQVWSRWGQDVQPEERVDWRLLASLQMLDKHLQESHLSPTVSHALIGKYVYLHYLRDRGILSQRKLSSWKIQASDVFGRRATLKGVENVVLQLDKWLNGDVFPISFRGKNAPNEEQLQQVSSIFAGDQLGQDGSSQLHLDFQAFDFSFIPIETLSAVYQQFLHQPQVQGGSNKGKEAGAYYTPIPLVNFMLAEVADRKPLTKGMKVLDPSCGSGAFLVQCFRRLVENEFPASAERPTPTQLRALLERSIFGVDKDPDACSVAELSLIITLLDYVIPPDLETRPTFKLPSLRNKNIFQSDFFSTVGLWGGNGSKRKFDWIVGNPPWKKLRPQKLAKDDEPAYEWIRNHKKSLPVGAYQLAQAFAWKILEWLAPRGEVGLLLPAMTLFENHSRGFREVFFQENDVHSIANLSNLRWVLFRGESVSPAAAVFYQPSKPEARNDYSRYVNVYSPMLANQEATRAVLANGKAEAWSLLLNTSEVRTIPQVDLSGGSGLAWKIAAWGSHLDRRLLEKLNRRFSSIGQLERDKVLIVAQGPELRPEQIEKGSNKTEICSETIGKMVLIEKNLSGKRPIFIFPTKALQKNSNHHLRIRGGKRGLTVCRPPHIIVNAARSFSVFLQDYLIIPPRQIGISSPVEDTKLLKAFSLYLSSDFALYHQFLTSAEFGVERGVATLKALRQMPIPLQNIKMEIWDRLHERISEANQGQLTGDKQNPLFDKPHPNEELEDLIVELNELVYDALQLTSQDRALIRDLVHVRLELIDGKLGDAAVKPPEKGQLELYAQRLKTELDSFSDGILRESHQVRLIFDDLSAMVQIDLVNKQTAVLVSPAGNATVRELDKARQNLRTKWSNWLYFDRNLRVFEGSQTYVLKPMQRLHWTESQAIFDASEIIAETLAGTVVPN